MKTSLVGSDLLLLAFHTFPQEVMLQFKQDMMVGFHILSTRPEYKHFFTNYHFDTDGAVPFSREIYEAWWDILIQSHLVSLDLGRGSDTALFEGGFVISFKYLERELSEHDREVGKTMSYELQQLLL